MANQKWEYDKDNMVLVTQSRKLLTKHPEEAAACFNNLNKVVTQLNCGHRLGSFGFNFFRSEGKGVYRIGQTAVSSSFEMRFYICFDEDKKNLLFSCSRRKAETGKRHRRLPKSGGKAVLKTKRGRYKVMNAKIKDIASLAGALTDSDEMKEQVERQVQNSQLINSLISMRINAGMSQTALSKHMHCSQGKVSKMESGTDESLNLYDVVKYASALDCNVQLCIESRNMPKAEKVKYHVTMVHRLLKDLAELAREDDKDGIIARKIHEFYGEVLLNFLLQFAENHNALKSCLSVSLGSTPEESEEGALELLPC
jgi:DNA-binding transcriptional regulator YiaG